MGIQWVLLFVLFTTATCHGAIVEKSWDYSHGDTKLQGFFYYDDSTDAKRPGVLVVHEWTGLGDYAKSRARQLAEMGYVAFAADMYGMGVYAKNHREAAALASPLLNDRQLMRQRITPGYEALNQHPLVDKARLGAIGYCFGGTAVLELARAGIPLKGVASFHGGLSTPSPRDASNIAGEILVCHGANDPNVPAKDVGAFMEEMQQGGVLYGLYAYPGAVHGFTVPEAGNDPSSGKAYNAQADQKSWQELRELFTRVFR